MLSFNDILGMFRNKCIEAHNATGNVSITSAEAFDRTAVFENNTVYVGYTSTANHFSDLSTGCFILMMDEELKTEISTDYLILNNTDNIFGIIESIRNTISESLYRTDEYTGLLSVFLNENDISLLIQKCASYIHNPIIITDTSYNIITCSHHEELDDEIWNTGTKRGNLTYEFVSLLTGKGSNYFETDGSRDSYIAEGISPHRRKVYKCQLDNTFRGYMIVLEYFHPFTDEYTQKEKAAQKLIAKQMGLSNVSTVNHYKKQEINLISDLLNSRMMSRQIFNTRQRSTFLTDFSWFQVISIDISSYSTTSGIIQGSLKTKLDMLENTLTVIFDKHILIISLLKSRVPQNTQEITDILNAYHLTAGCSAAFNDLFYLHSYYVQSLNAIRFNTMISQKGPLYHYEEISFYHLLSTIDSDDLLRFCSEKIIDIYNDDVSHHTDNLDTLYQYLRFGQNVSKTAQHMYLHRNTINYRISNIIDDYSLNLDNPDAAFAYYFSAVIIRYLYKTENIPNEV